MIECEMSENEIKSMLVVICDNFYRFKINHFDSYFNQILFNLILVQYTEFSADSFRWN